MYKNNRSLAVNSTVYRKRISPLALGEHKAVRGTVSARPLEARKRGLTSPAVVVVLYSGRGSPSYDARPRKGVLGLGLYAKIGSLARSKNPGSGRPPRLYTSITRAGSEV